MCFLLLPFGFGGSRIQSLGLAWSFAGHCNGVKTPLQQVVRPFIIIISRINLNPEANNYPWTFRTNFSGLSFGIASSRSPNFNRMPESPEATYIYKLIGGLYLNPQKDVE